MQEKSLIRKEIIVIRLQIRSELTKLVRLG